MSSLFLPSSFLLFTSYFLFLTVKPLQRLCKYPLLFREILKTYEDSNSSEEEVVLLSFLNTGSLSSYFLLLTPTFTFTLTLTLAFTLTLTFISYRTNSRVWSIQESSKVHGGVYFLLFTSIFSAYLLLHISYFLFLKSYSLFLSLFLFLSFSVPLSLFLLYFPSLCLFTYFLGSTRKSE